MRTFFGIILLLTVVPLQAQSRCEDQSEATALVRTAPAYAANPLIDRLMSYVAEARKHRMTGLASYYSASLDGTLTANGERYHRRRLSAAHLTLPLGCWLDIRSVATRKRVRLRVNDRGPYVRKFAIDLSEAAARAIGVDVAEDRSVIMSIVALPGEDPLPLSALQPVPCAMCEESAAGQR